MDILEFQNMFEVEDQHWWFKGKREIIKYLLQAELKPGRRALDFGCGCGAILKSLSREVEVEGVDISRTAIDFCRQRGLKNVMVIKLDQWRPKPDYYDLIIISDVLEHVENDLALLRKLYSALRQGGILLATVPAFNFLWSNHDLILHHKRRYTRPALIKAARQAGFDWSFISYYNFWLFLPVLAVRTFRKLFRPVSTKSDTIPIPGRLMNKIFYLIFKSEQYFLKKLVFPFGVSLIAITRKRSF